MPQITAPRVFTALEKKTLGTTVANALRELLLNGDPGRGQDGILSLEYINRKGAGGGRDKTTTIRPQVLFPDDGKASIPYVQIVGIQIMGAREPWGDDKWLVPCAAALDCSANGSFPGGYTEAVDAGTADAILGDFVLDLVSNYEVMTAAGFAEPKARPEAPPGATTKDGAPWEFHSPVMVDFDLYVLRS